MENINNNNNNNNISISPKTQIILEELQRFLSVNKLIDSSFKDDNKELDRKVKELAEMIRVYLAQEEQQQKEKEKEKDA